MSEHDDTALNVDPAIAAKGQALWQLLHGNQLIPDGLSVIVMRMASYEVLLERMQKRIDELEARQKGGAS